MDEASSINNTIKLKQDVRHAKKNSMTSESGKYSVDLKRIRDWMKNFEICRMK